MISVSDNINYGTGRLCVGPSDHTRDNLYRLRDHTGADTRSAHTISLPRLMQHIKSYTTVEYIKGVYNDNWIPFEKHLWQRSYHDIIVRADGNLNRIRQYIFNNPAKWAKDTNYHDNML